MVVKLPTAAGESARPPGFAHQADQPTSQPGPGRFVQLKLRILRNALRGRPWRIGLFIVGVVFGGIAAIVGFASFFAAGSASGRAGQTVAAILGAVLVLGWTLLPLLLFGVDETLDPARFALLPLHRRTLAQGMLAAALVGVPPVATLLASLGLVVGVTSRYGPVAGAAALLGVLLALLLCVLASRAVTSGFADLLRSRRVRDLAGVIIALLASSIGPLQLLLLSMVEDGDTGRLHQVGGIVGWTPFGAPYLIGLDVAHGRPLAALARTVLVLVTIGLLAWWWSRTIESAMLGTSSSSTSRRSAAPRSTASSSAGLGTAGPGAAVGSADGRPGPDGRAGGATVAGLLARIGGGPVFQAVLNRELRYWWRDPRRRSGLISILIAGAAMPLLLGLTSPGGSTGPVTFTSMIAALAAGILLVNQFGYDADAYAAHLLAQVPGRADLRARATALGLLMLPVLATIAIVVGIGTGAVGAIPGTLGGLVAGFGSAMAASALVCVLIPYPYPESSNPFAMNGGGASARSLFSLIALIGAAMVAAPMIVAALLVHGPATWLLLPVGVGYGFGVTALSTHIAGSILDRRGPEVLAAVTPRR